MANLLVRRGYGVLVRHVTLTLTDSSDRRRTSRRLGTSATASFTVEVSEEEFGGDVDDLESAVDTVATNSTTFVAEMQETAEEKGSSTDFSAMTVTDVETVEVTRPPTRLPTSSPAPDETDQAGVLDSATVQLAGIIAGVGLIALSCAAYRHYRKGGQKGLRRKGVARESLEPTFADSFDATGLDGAFAQRENPMMAAAQSTRTPKRLTRLNDPAREPAIEVEMTTTTTSDEGPGRLSVENPLRAESERNHVTVEIGANEASQAARTSSSTANPEDSHQAHRPGTTMADKRAVGSVVESIDPSTGRPYYYSNRTGETSWRRSQVATTVGAAIIEGAESTEAEVVAGWEKIVDPNSGAEYWYNHETSETTWETPQVVRDAM